MLRGQPGGGCPPISFGYVDVRLRILHLCILFFGDGFSGQERRRGYVLSFGEIVLHAGEFF